VAWRFREVEVKSFPSLLTFQVLYSAQHTRIRDTIASSQVQSVYTLNHIQSQAFTNYHKMFSLSHTSTINHKKFSTWSKTWSTTIGAIFSPRFTVPSVDFNMQSRINSIDWCRSRPLSRSFLLALRRRLCINLLNHIVMLHLAPLYPLQQLSFPRHLSTFQHRQWSDLMKVQLPNIFSSFSLLQMVFPFRIDVALVEGKCMKTASCR